MSIKQDFLGSVETQLLSANGSTLLRIDELSNRPSGEQKNLSFGTGTPPCADIGQGLPFDFFSFVLGAEWVHPPLRIGHIILEIFYAHACKTKPAILAPSAIAGGRDAK